MEQEKKNEQNNNPSKGGNPHYRRRRHHNHKPAAKEEGAQGGAAPQNAKGAPKQEQKNTPKQAAKNPPAQEVKNPTKQEKRPSGKNPTENNGAPNNNHKRRDHRRSPKKPQAVLTETMEETVAAPVPAFEPAAEPESDPNSPPPADVLETPILRTVAIAEDEPVIEVVGIRFKAGGKTYYFAPGNLQATRGSYAIVETARGPEYGEVSLANTRVRESDIVPPLRPVLRLATDADKKHHEENLQKEKMAMKVCAERIAVHKLDMKLIDAQYTFDNSKLLFYFTSAGRVDFRELVKDLASVFRTRIELRQIGIRDEAKLLGGLGLCGRPLCCSVFLTDFGQVSIKMAKEQNLSLNSAKISGACGRLMCCLRFEHETYEQEIRMTPPVDALVKTPEGNGVVTEVTPLQGMIKVRLLDKADNPPVPYHRDQVEVLQTKFKKDGGTDKS